MVGSRSIQPRKQRKFRYTAPLHAQQSHLNVHLSKELRTKTKKRAVRVRAGDKVKVMRGKFKGKTGAVIKVFLAKRRITVEGLIQRKAKGQEVFHPVDPSNVMITEMVSRK